LSPPGGRNVLPCRVRLVTCLLLVLFAIGCGGRTCPVFPHTDARAALRSHASARVRLAAIRAEARVDQRGRKGRIRGTVFMFVQRPDRVRFDAMTQFGPAAILTSNGGSFAFTDLRKNRFYRGPTCAANIERLLGLHLSAADTAALLLGQSPVLEEAKASMTCTGDGFYRLDLRAADGRRQQVDLGVNDSDLKAPPAKQRLRLLRSELYGRRGKTLWRVTYDDYRIIPVGTKGVAMPFEVRVEQPAIGTDTLVRFRRVDANPEIASTVFLQQARPGVPVEQIACDSP
jgi:hypothetical protein